MVNYKLSKLYRLYSAETNEIYVGSTTKPRLSQRIGGHRSGYRGWVAGKQHYISSYELMKYDDVKIGLLEAYPCNNIDELRAREQYWIDKFKTICVNKHTAHGFNKRENDKKLYNTNKDRILKQQKEYKSRPEIKQLKQMTAFLSKIKKDKQFIDDDDRKLIENWHREMHRPKLNMCMSELEQYCDYDFISAPHHYKDSYQKQRWDEHMEDNRLD
jgi:hypothetical protein